MKVGTWYHANVLYKGKKMELGAPPPNPRFNTPSVPRGQDGKIKDTFGGRKAMNHQFTSSLHASHAKGQK